MMGEKMQIGFKVDSDIFREFEKVLDDFHEATGIKPVKQESYETAMKDYVIKLRKQIEVLKES